MYLRQSQAGFEPPTFKTQRMAYFICWFYPAHTLSLGKFFMNYPVTLKTTYDFLQVIEGRGLGFLVGADNLAKDLLLRGRRLRDFAVADLGLLVVGDDESGAVERGADLQLVAALHPLGLRVQRV